LGSRAQEAALRLARVLGARLEPGDLAFMAPYYSSLKQHGLYWAPLEVLRDEAEAVLFWGANPLHSCPRQVVRYTVFARGRFTERGVEDRRVAAVDIYRTEMAKFCQLFIEIEPGQELPLIKGVRGLLTGEQGITPRVKGTKKLADFLAQAGYGAIFCGRGVGYGPVAELFDELAGLTAWLNQRVPFVLFPLAGDFNTAGLYHLLLRELGSPFAPDFGDPSGLACHSTPVDFSQKDAVLVAGADLFWLLPEDRVKELESRQVPIIVLSPFANRTTASAQVVFPVALAGVEAEEVAYRMDGLPVALRKLVPSAWPTDQQILNDLAAAV
jgi:formylmethanofuran dehydrogenase subunit B